MSLRQNRVAGSVVTVVYDDHEEAPAFQERKLETELRRLFPTGCGVTVVVDVAWSEESAAWRLLRAQVELGGSPIQIGPGLARSLKETGTPLSLA
jgi:hypothetical protein